MLGAPPTPAAVQPTKPDTSGASTSGTTPPASNSTTRNMRPSNKLVDRSLEESNSGKDVPEQALQSENL
jgi:hypothetical protein